MVNEIFEMIIDRRSVDCVDFVENNREIVLLEIVGQSQICRSVSAYFMSGNRSVAALIGDKNYFIGETSYARVEDVIKEGYSHITIYQRDIFQDCNMFFFPSRDKEDLMNGFKTWLNKIALPVPREEGFIQFFLQTLLDTRNIELKMSLNGLYNYGVVNFARLSANDYEELAYIIEACYAEYKKSNFKIQGVA